MENVPLSVSDALALVNQTLEYAFPIIIVEGEVSGFKVNQAKYVFFDLKDESSTLGCFMTVYQLRIPIEDGMRVQVVAQPKLTQWGKFSLTVREVRPIGEGSLKRAFDILKARLDKEGLFAPERKRVLPRMPRRVGVVSSTAAAGYIDFTKILDRRWSGMEIVVAHVQVQGMAAPRQMIAALDHLNQMTEPVEVIAIIRGGGSLDDLNAFNDEQLVRAVALSRAPIISGIGHEVDNSLVDLAADVRASTPSNAAEILVPDRRDIFESTSRDCSQMIKHYTRHLMSLQTEVIADVGIMRQHLDQVIERLSAVVLEQMAVLRQLDPKMALSRGYSLLRDDAHRLITVAAIGDTVTIETNHTIITAGVEDVQDK